MKILAISGSLRASRTTRLSRGPPRELAPDGVEIEVYEGLGLAPALRRRISTRRASRLPRPSRELRRRIEEADALLIVTPEYNGSIPGVLKNAIDWVSARHRGSWLRNKTVAIAGATTGQYGAIWAQQDLRRILGIAGARVVGGRAPGLSGRTTRSTRPGRCASPLVAERLRSHLAALVARGEPLNAAA